MRTKLIAAAVSIVALAMPATAMAGSGGGGPHAGGSASADRGATEHTYTTVLARGAGYDRPGGSPAVRELQRRLAHAGFAPGPFDGLYGPRTEMAVSQFQADRGLSVDGIAGPHTLAAVASPTPTLYPGAGYGPHTSQLVRRLQRLLIRAGYSPGPADGLYGPRTEHAVRRFEAMHRLAVDGIARPRAFVVLAAQVRTRVGTTRSSIHHRPPLATTPRATTTVPESTPANAQPAQPANGHPVVWIGFLAAVLALALLLATVTLRTRRRPGAEPGSPFRGPGGPQSDPAADVAARAHGHLSDADEAFRLGVLLEEQSDLASAEVAYRRADAQSHAAAASNLGVLLERRGEEAEAAAAYRRASERGDPNGAFNLAMLLEEQNDVAGAEEAYRQADAQSHAAAASNLGVLLERRGDLAGAESAYRRADERGDPNGAFNLAVLLEEQNQLAGAEAAYRRADERGPAEVANAARAALRNLRGPRTAARGASGGGARAG